MYWLRSPAPAYVLAAVSRVPFCIGRGLPLAAVSRVHLCAGRGLPRTLLYKPRSPAYPCVLAAVSRVQLCADRGLPRTLLFWPRSLSRVHTATFAENRVRGEPRRSLDSSPSAAMWLWEPEAEPSPRRPQRGGDGWWWFYHGRWWPPVAVWWEPEEEPEPWWWRPWWWL